MECVNYGDNSANHLKVMVYQNSVAYLKLIASHGIHSASIMLLYSD
jgi:hypothetical protein